MDLVGLKPIVRTTTSFSALTLLVGSFDPQKPVPDMTYDVFSGTLNPTLGAQIFDSGYFAHFLSARNEIWRRQGYSQSNLVNFGHAGGLATPCGDMHKSFTMLYRESILLLTPQMSSGMCE